MSEPTNTRKSAEGTAASAEPTTITVAGETAITTGPPERIVSDIRYKHMGNEWESHLQAMRGLKRRSLRGSDDFPGSFWEPVEEERYGPEPEQPASK